MENEMSIELKGNGGYLNLRHSDWRDILDLAEMFGWNRKGTVAPRDLDRDESGEWPDCFPAESQRAMVAGNPLHH